MERLILMNCKYCGAELGDNDQFCPDCGKPVGEKTDNISENAAAVEAVSEETPASHEPVVDGSPAESASLPERPEFEVVPSQEPAGQAYNGQPFGDQPSSGQSFDYQPLSGQQPVYGGPEAAMVVPAQKKSKKKLLLVIAGVVVVVLAAVAMLIYSVFNSGIGGLMSAVVKTAAVYSSELGTAAKNHKATARIKELAEGNVDQKFMLDDLTFIMQKDKENKVFRAGMEIDDYYMNSNLNIYFTEDSVIGGMDGVLYAESPGTEIVAQTRRLSQNLETVFPDELYQALSVVERVYKGEDTEPQAVDEKVVQGGMKVFQQLFTKGNLDKDRGELPIGDGTKSCSTYKINHTGDSLANWIDEDVIPWVEENPEVQEALSSVASYAGETTGIMEELVYFRDEARAQGSKLSLDITCFEYKGILPRIDVTISYDEETIKIVCGTKGKDHFLNDIYFNMSTNYETVDISFVGNHISMGNIDSSLSINTDGEQIDIQIQLDEEKTADNLTFSSPQADSDQTITFAVVGDSVIMDTGEDADLRMYIEMKPLQEEIELPENTVPLKDLTAQMIFGFLYGDLYGGVL